ncbi:MAG: hypothetical protein NTW49_11220 [Bacteroidia bacterium]|nr:hypothetical protein [Bacteroidia bacterium]
MICTILKNGPISYPSFLYSGGTKNGIYQGGETIENLVDIRIKMESETVSLNKNRFGGEGTILVY